MDMTRGDLSRIASEDNDVIKLIIKRNKEHMDHMNSVSLKFNALNRQICSLQKEKLDIKDSVVQDTSYIHHELIKTKNELEDLKEKLHNSIIFAMSAAEKETTDIANELVQIKSQFHLIIAQFEALGTPNEDIIANSITQKLLPYCLHRKKVDNSPSSSSLSRICFAHGGAHEHLCRIQANEKFPIYIDVLSIGKFFLTDSLNNGTFCISGKAIHAMTNEFIVAGHSVILVAPHRYKCLKEKVSDLEQLNVYINSSLGKARWMTFPAKDTRQELVMHAIEDFGMIISNDEFDDISFANPPAVLSYIIDSVYHVDFNFFNSKQILPFHYKDVPTSINKKALKPTIEKYTKFCVQFRLTPSTNKKMEHRLGFHKILT